MTAHTPGKIFLADQRGMVETHDFRRYCTFSFGSYAHPDKAPVGRLHAFNEEILAAHHTLEFTVSEAAHILLLPVTGALSFSTTPGPGATVNVEEMQLVSLPAGSFLRLSNSYDNDLISFIHIWLLADNPSKLPSPQSLPFNLAATENQLLRLPFILDQGAGLFSVNIGRFTGRSETIYQPAPGACFFAFVLAGAFEVEGRLLHERDGLALWQATRIELEALSNHAVLIVLELK